MHVEADLQVRLRPADTGSVADSRSTGTRLTFALLGYFVLVTAVITLSPFDFGLRRFRISLSLVSADIVANIALFLPIAALVSSTVP